MVTEDIQRISTLGCNVCGMRSEKPKIPKLPSWAHGSTSNLANRTQKETAVGTPQQKCEKMSAMLCLDDLDGYNSIESRPQGCVSSVSLGLVECFNLAVWTAPITGPQIRLPIQIEDTGQRVKGSKGLDQDRMQDIVARHGIRPKR